MDEVFLYDLEATRTDPILIFAAPVTGSTIPGIGTFNVYAIAHVTEPILSSKINRDDQVVSGSLIFVLGNETTITVTTQNPDVQLYRGLIDPQPITQTESIVIEENNPFFFVRLIEEPTIPQLTEFSAARLPISITYKSESRAYGVY